MHVCIYIPRIERLWSLSSWRELSADSRSCTITENALRRVEQIEANNYEKFSFWKDNLAKFIVNG